jgi:hypothetical protein
VWLTVDIVFTTSALTSRPPCLFVSQDDPALAADLSIQARLHARAGRRFLGELTYNHDLCACRKSLDNRSTASEITIRTEVEFERARPMPLVAKRVTRREMAQRAAGAKPIEARARRVSCGLHVDRRGSRAPVGDASKIVRG